MKSPKFIHLHDPLSIMHFFLAVDNPPPFLAWRHLRVATLGLHVFVKGTLINDVIQRGGSGVGYFMAQVYKTESLEAWEKG